MKLEAGKEMDRCCVLGWLNEVYRHPTVAFNTYSDEQQIEFAHDALVLLKEQERKKGSWDYGTQCSVCKGTIVPPWKRDTRVNFCPWCGADMRNSYESEGR